MLQHFLDRENFSCGVISRSPKWKVKWCNHKNKRYSHEKLLTGGIVWKNAVGKAFFCLFHSWYLFSVHADFGRFWHCGLQTMKKLKSV